MAASMLRTFGRDRSGIAAVEFAFIAPVLLVIIAGAAELSSAITSANRATFVADAIGEMVSRTPVDKTLTDTDPKNFAIAGALINPDIARYAKQTGTSLEAAFRVTISSVDFKPRGGATCTQPCQYDANVVFSYPLNAASGQRTCGQLLTPTAVASNDLAKLPAELYRGGTLVVVDAAVIHRPLVFGYVRYFGGDITFNRSSYFRPRERARVDASRNCTAYAVS